jgi:hypothetical protein
MDQKTETHWLRKRPFWGDLRRFLKGFRVVQVKTTIGAEMGAPPMLQRQAGAYVPTGRRIITITLIGYQRSPAKVELEAGKEGVEHEGVIIPATLGESNDPKPEANR